MARNSKDVVDITIARFFRLMLVFGLTTHLYDTKKHRLVHSRRAHCYSLSLHVTIVILFVVLTIIVPLISEPVEVNKCLNILYAFISLVHYMTICMSLGLQWTVRANAAQLFNEIIQIWRKVTARFPESEEGLRQAAALFILKTLQSVTIVVYLIFETAIVYSTRNVAAIPMRALSAISLLLLCQFCTGIVFCIYLFRILNLNLARVVEGINSVSSWQRSPSVLRDKVVALEKQLSQIERIHRQLQEWVIRFKTSYELELLFNMFSFFGVAVLGSYLVCLLLYSGGKTQPSLHIPILATVMYFLNSLSLFYMCGQLVDAVHEPGLIMENLRLPAEELCCVQLQGCVERMCFKLRLRICGLFDLDWGNVFPAMEPVLLYIIIVIQWVVNC